MIKRICANKDTFRDISFTDGLNIILADRTLESTKKDSRNGIGKSTLVNVINFIYGSDVRRKSNLSKKSLEDWTFSADIEIDEREIIKVSRTLGNPGTVNIVGEIIFEIPRETIPLPSFGQSIEIEDYKAYLGKKFFGLDEIIIKQKHSPSFRSLFSYFSRREVGGYNSPFEYFSRQPRWSIQVNNAYLLGLNWKSVIDLQVIIDKKNQINSLKKVMKSNEFTKFFSTKGELEVERTRLTSKLNQLEDDIRDFNVHPHYREIQKKVNGISEEIRALSNKLNINNQLINLYDKAINDEADVDSFDLAQIYKEAGLLFPEITLQKLSVVKKFHEQITMNRRDFLLNELSKIDEENSHLKDNIDSLNFDRSKYLKIIDSHGALTDLQVLQQRQIDLSNKYNEVLKSLDQLKKIQEESSTLKIAQEKWVKNARRDYEERASIREKAIDLFNSFSKRLYNAPGDLIIDVDNNGYNFDIEIEKSSSQGIGNMKIFCYDLTLACLWAEKNSVPLPLIHDSLIFDGVDERQIALGLELVNELTDEYGFQYICTMNSDMVPYSEFSKGFDFESKVSFRLSDEDISESLLGIKF